MPRPCAGAVHSELQSPPFLAGSVPAVVSPLTDLDRRNQRETENDASGERRINHRYVDLPIDKEGRDERGLNQFPTIIVSTFALTTPAIRLKIRGKAVALRADAARAAVMNHIHLTGLLAI
jgi:hypothetical protein